MSTASARVAFIFASLVLASCGDEEPTDADDVAVLASVWVTTADQAHLLSPQEPISFAPDRETDPQLTTVDVDEAQRFQIVHGFGAALTDSSAWLIAKRLNAEQRGALMRALFDPQSGLGLSTLRHVAGASDFALSDYTYDDVPPGETDYDLARFSIEHDREYIIPVLSEARALNPQLKLIGTPWSAPGWMKTSGSVIGGSLRPESARAYANYLVRYIRAFAAEGVPLDAISPVNEPLFVPPSYPGMLMEAPDQAAFVKHELGPALAAAGVFVPLLIFDHNWDRADFPIHVLNDSEARAYIEGTAFHCYSGDVTTQQVLHDLHPDKSIVLSECTGSVGSAFDQDLRWGMRNLFIGAVRNWATDVLLWNLALDEQSGPQNGGCTNCRGVVTIDQATGTVTRNVEYYALGHASLAARPGAMRIGSTTFQGGIESVAFVNRDASKGLLVFNDGTTEAKFKVRWAGLAFPFTLPAGAVATFRWP